MGDPGRCGYFRSDRSFPPGTDSGEFKGIKLRTIFRGGITKNRSVFSGIVTINMGFIIYQKSLRPDDIYQPTVRAIFLLGLNSTQNCV